MITIYLSGGLGNQMFQFSAAYQISLYKKSVLRTEPRATKTARGGAGLGRFLGQDRFIEESMEAAGASPPGVASRLAAALSATAEATSTEALSRAHDAAMQELDKYDNTVRGLFSNVSGGQAGQPSLRMLVYNAATAPTASDLDRASAAAMTALASVDSVRVTGASFAYSEKEAADINGWSHAKVATLVTPHLVNCRNTVSDGEHAAFTVTCTTALGKKISTNGIAEEIAHVLLSRANSGGRRAARRPPVNPQDNCDCAAGAAELPGPAAQSRRDPHAVRRVPADQQRADQRAGKPRKASRYRSCV